MCVPLVHPLRGAPGPSTVMCAQGRGGMTPAVLAIVLVSIMV